MEYLSEQKYHIICETIFVDGFTVLGYSKADIRKFDGHSIELLHTLLVQLLQHINTLTVLQSQGQLQAGSRRYFIHYLKESNHSHVL